MEEGRQQIDTTGKKEERKRKERQRGKHLSALGRKIRASHYADVNLAARQEPQ